MRKKKNNIDDIEILEFEEDKKESKFKQIKEFLSDKRNKALVKLSIYAIFILFAVFYVRYINNKNLEAKANQTINENENTVIEELPKTITDKLQLLKSNRNYELTINYFSVGNSMNEYSATAKIVDNNLTVTYNDINYNYDENGFYILDNENKIYENSFFLEQIPLYLSNKIYSYLSKAEFQYKREDALNNTNINSFLSLSNFGLLNDNIIDSDDYIVIDTIENNSNNIVVNLIMTSYYQKSDDSITNCTVKLEFKY